LKRDFRILTEIGNLLYKEKNKPAFEAKPATGSGVTPSFTEVKPKEKNINNLFPLSLFQRKGSFLTNKTYDYLNSVSCSPSSGPAVLGQGLLLPKVNPGQKATPTNLRGNLNEQKVSSSFTSLKPKVKTSLKVNDVIYQYLKTFSIFNKRKNGILIKYNQHIGYNFNSKNILLRGVEPKIISELVPNKSIPGGLPLKNKNIINHFYYNGPLLKKEPQINTEIAKELNRLKGVSGLTGYNRSCNNRLIKYSYKLLFYFFKSMYCLISKPVFLFYS
jgi:hypothetical protein